MKIADLYMGRTDYWGVKVLGKKEEDNERERLKQELISLIERIAKKYGDKFLLLETKSLLLSHKSIKELSNAIPGYAIVPEDIDVIANRALGFIRNCIKDLEELRDFYKHVFGSESSEVKTVNSCIQNLRIRYIDLDYARIECSRFGSRLLEKKIIADKWICPGCEMEVNPLVCFCGEEKINHDKKHKFRPKGCVCTPERSESLGEAIDRILTYSFGDGENKE